MAPSLSWLLLVCLWLPDQVQPATDPPEIDLQALVMQQAQVIEQLQSRMTSLESAASQSGGSGGGTDRRVAFHVRLKQGQHDVHNLSDGDRIVYSGVLLNDGEYYDNKTGIFTAPVSGVYHFDMKIAQNPPGTIHARIYAGSHPIAEAMVSGEASGGHDRAATSVIAHVREGQHVSVEVDQASTSLSGGPYQNSFSGFLIYEDQ